MAKKRTRKQKRLASQRRQMESQSLKVNSQNISLKVKTGEKTNKVDTIDGKKSVTILVDEKEKRISNIVSLLGYDPKLLKQDLLKTVLLSVVMFGGVVGLYFYLR